MAKRSTISGLPQDLRDELNARLVAGGFSDYAGLTQWLNDELQARGESARVSRSALHRHGSEFQDEYEAHMRESRLMYEVAKAGLEQGDDPDGVLQEATHQALHTGLLRLSVTIRKLQQTEDPKTIAKLLSQVTRAAADLGRANIATKKWRADIRKEAMEEAAQRAAAVAKSDGVSAETIAKIRRDVLGMAE